MNADIIATSSSNVKALYERMVSLKREAYALLDQALTLDSKTEDKASKSHEMTVGLYEKALKAISSALDLYSNNANSLGKLEEAVVLHNQLSKMRQQTAERLGYLQSLTKKPISNNIQSPMSTLNNNEFLEIGDEILSDDEFIIVDDDANNEEVNPSTTSKDDSYSKLQKRLRLDNKFAKATEICRVDNGVQLFYIANDGSVSTPSHPTTLSVYAFNNDQISNDQILGFIRVGSWVYPLMPSISPAMKTNFNAYIFPNEDEETNNKKADELVIKCNFVGITFAHSTKDQQETFEDILANYGSLIYQDQSAPSGVKHPSIAPPRPQTVPQASTSTSSATSTSLVSSETILRPTNEKERPPFALDERSKIRDEKELEKYNEKEKEAAEDKNKESNESTADYIAKNLLIGADYVVRGVSTTSDYASKYINKGGEKLKTNITPNEQVTHVSPSVQKTIQGVRYGTHLTVRVSSFLLNKLGSIASATARTVAPYIREGSVSLLSKTGVANDRSAANGYVDGFCTVAGSSVRGFVMVQDSLEDAAKTLAKNITEQTVQVTDYKYGPSVAKATENGLYSIGNVALCANNVRNLKVVRTIAKATVKETIHPSDKKQLVEPTTKLIENKK